MLLSAAVLAAAVAVTVVFVIRAGERDVTPVTDLASRLGCSGFTQGTQIELFVREQGDCQFDGATVTLHTFTTGDAAASWLQVAQNFGGIYVVGDRWAISVDTQDKANAVRAKLGGDIR
jgi:hypothetical protein